MLNCSSHKILFMALVSYTRLNNNILLGLHPPICILLYTNSTLMMLFPSLLPNVYPVFSVKLTVTARKTRLNRKQIRIIPGFIYTKYKVQGAMFKSAVLNLQRKTSNRSTEYHKWFCSTCVQLFRLQSLKKVLLLTPISLGKINNQLYHQLLPKNN